MLPFFYGEIIPYCSVHYRQGMTMKHVFIVLLLVILFLSIHMPARAQEQIVPDSQAQISLSFAPLVKKVAPAVVNIYTKRTVMAQVSPFAADPLFRQFFGNNFMGGGLTRQQVENSLGSGVIANADGLVVTNAHVVKGAEEIKIVLPDGREFSAQKILADTPSDIAILRIDGAKEAALPHVTFKPSENLAVGDLVLAIGNPFGVGQTVTSGIVSALARSSLNINDFNFFIQTDAAINPGNSGGPLVAMDGSVIGINSAIYSRDGGSLGIGFAIPSEMVATVIAAAEGGQKGETGVVRPWLGIAAQPVTQDIADSLRLKTPGGVLIAGLQEASPAKDAGIKTGDIVLAVNNHNVRDPSEMKFRMATVPLGQDADFKIIRNGKERLIKVKAIAPPDLPPRESATLNGNHPLNGMTIANVNPAVAVELGLKDDRGVVVIKLSPQGQASQILRPGDILLSLNGQKVESVADAKKALLAPTAAGWQIIFARNGVQNQLVIR